MRPRRRPGTQQPLRHEVSLCPLKTVPSRSSGELQGSTPAASASSTGALNGDKPRANPEPSGEGPAGWVRCHDSGGGFQELKATLHGTQLWPCKTHSAFGAGSDMQCVQGNARHTGGCLPLAIFTDSNAPQPLFIRYFS